MFTEARQELEEEDVESLPSLAGYVSGIVSSLSLHQQRQSGSSLNINDERK
ncbi:hypothetical protein F2Q69_00038061 [Brassica cretica]|uniref:Uncharacterized protein n=2 Tax=Brassica cretica TaxID=69181 RepID=A0A8S9SEY1_BRACR|nr:hypothetical protein DY000_02042625 [Brassica cretica]KAF3598613.1 hypothetical protein F2Q69_00038061 [Brassica cretica]